MTPNPTHLIALTTLARRRAERAVARSEQSVSTFRADLKRLEAQLQVMDQPRGLDGAPLTCFGPHLSRLIRELAALEKRLRAAERQLVEDRSALSKHIYSEERLSAES